MTVTGSVAWLWLAVFLGTSEASAQDWRITTALTVATVYDIETTFRGLERCPTCTEQSPLGRWFVDRGRLPTYAVQLGLNSGLLLLSRAKGSGWTSAALTLAVGHLIAGTLNLRFIL